MSFNWNAINASTFGLEKSGKPPAVYLDPEMKGWKVSNHAITVKSGHKPESAMPPRLEDDTILVEGKMPESVPEFVIYKGITDPVSWSGEALRAFLQQRGITVNGTVKAGKTPASAELLAKFDSQPVGALVVRYDEVLEQLRRGNADEGAGREIRRATGDASKTASKSLLTRIVGMGLKKDRFRFLKVTSGLSRRFFPFRPADLAFLLEENYKRFSYAPEFLVSLPLAGVDGTLKKRIKNSDAVGWIRAKTGSLNGVVGLAGYAGQKEGGARAFVFIFNGPAERRRIRPDAYLTLSPLNWWQ